MDALDEISNKNAYPSDTVDFNGENKEVQNKATSIKMFVRLMELQLGGYTWDSKIDKFKYTGDQLCGDNVIRKAVALIQPFAEDANLITTKEFKEFSNQKWENFSTFNKTLLGDVGGISENNEVVMKVFKNTLKNIGGIILGSKGVLQDWYGKEKEQTKEPLG